MSRESVLILLGVITAFAPFSGLPIVWLLWILPIVGICVVIIGISLKLQKLLTSIPAVDEENNID